MNHNRATISAPINAQATCSECGAPVADHAPRGLCPGCLIKLAGSPDSLIDEPASLPTAEPTSASTHPVSRIAHHESPITEAFPRSFADYELLEEIARGGMGIVYKARQKSLNRIVAIKMILAGQFAGKQMTQRFRGEAAAAGTLQHPNIVAIHDIGMHEGQHFFSMDYVEG